MSLSYTTLLLKLWAQINSLDAAKDARNKSKDIHLPSIDVSFGSNRILYGLPSPCTFEFMLM